MIAPFVDVPTLVTTYKIAGTIPILSPVARYPWLFEFLSSHIKEDWSTRTRIADYVRRSERSEHNYRIILAHAEDDYDIPWNHTPMLFSHAVDAASPEVTVKLDEWKLENGQDLGAAGHVAHWNARHGVISEYLLKHGLHDVVMGAPVVTLAVMGILNEGQ